MSLCHPKFLFQDCSIHTYCHAPGFWFVETPWRVCTLTIFALNIVNILPSLSLAFYTLQYLHHTKHLIFMKSQTNAHTHIHTHTGSSESLWKMDMIKNKYRFQNFIASKLNILNAIFHKLFGIFLHIFILYWFSLYEVSISCFPWFHLPFPNLAFFWLFTLNWNPCGMCLNVGVPIPPYRCAHRHLWTLVQLMLSFRRTANTVN